MNKKKLYNHVKKLFLYDENIISISFVGSFNYKKNFNDIDLVFILSEVNVRNFNSIINKISSLKKSKLFKDKNLIINNLLGPVKFNLQKNDIVLHVMIYSLSQHIEHSAKSPFTCFDWERSSNYIGKSISDCFSVRTLMLSDFISSVRGIGNFNKDISNNQISCIKYYKYNNKILLKKIKIKIDNRNQFSYPKSLIINTVKNFLKYINQNNKEYSLKNVWEFLVKKKILNKKEILILKTSIRINEIKKISVIFIQNFLYHLKYIKKNSISINFLRHLETILPSRIFIGQKINPLLKQSNKDNKYSLGDLSVINNKIIYTSSSLRSQNTSSVLFPGHKYQVLKLVDEIDYGLVEGLDFVQLKKYFYKLYIKKKNGKKFKYPRGESYNDVRKRIFLLIKKFSYDKKNSIIITHNVFIRVLLGMFLKVKDSELHHISINYGQNFHFILYNNRLYPNFPRPYLLNLFSRNYVNS